MTMDIECEEPKEKCESLAEQAEEIATFEIPDNLHFSVELFLRLLILRTPVTMPALAFLC